MNGRRGFTLIELLIVVAIISILAAIAVPNFLEAQTRAKVSRAKADMRTLATALESYFVDTNHYPPRQNWPIFVSQLRLGDTMTRAEDIKALTSPIAYITSLPKDVFENRVAAPNDILDYYSPYIVEVMRAARFPSKLDAPEDTLRNSPTTYGFGWMLFSVGPDAQLGTSSVAGNYPVIDTVNGNTWIHEYDPTNGTISLGNVTRFHKNGATADDAYFISP